MEFIDTDGAIDKSYSDEIEALSPSQAYVAGVKFAEKFMRNEMVDLLAYCGIETDGSLLDSYLDDKESRNT